MQGNSSTALAQTKTDYDAFLGDAANLQAVRNALQDTKLSAELRKTLEIMQKTFLCYITEDPQATAMKVGHSTCKSAQLYVGRARNEFCLWNNVLGQHISVLDLPSGFSAYDTMQKA